MKFAIAFLLIVMIFGCSKESTKSLLISNKSSEVKRVSVLFSNSIALFTNKSFDELFNDVNASRTVLTNQGANNFFSADTSLEKRHYWVGSMSFVGSSNQSAITGLAGTFSYPWFSLEATQWEYIDISDSGITKRQTLGD